MVAGARKWILRAGAPALIALVAGAAAWWFWLRPPSAPEPDKAAPVAVARYMASDDFARLSEKDRREYFEKARTAQTNPAAAFRAAEELTQEERDKLFKNVGPMFRRQMEQQVDQYFELPPEQRTAYLDKLIDRMQWMQAIPRPRGGGDSAGGSSSGTSAPSGRRDGFTPERMRRMIETTEPQQRAKFVEFFKELRARAEQRHVPMRGM